MNSFEGFIVDHYLNTKCHIMISGGRSFTGHLVHIRTGTFKLVTKNLANQHKELYIPIEHIVALEDA